MNYKKICSLVFFITLNFACVQAQLTNDYKAEWKKVADLEKKGLTQSALQLVIKIFDAANRSGNEGQQVKAAMYQMKYRNLVEEDNRENNIFYLDTLIAKSKAPARNILQSMQAELFRTYKQYNRYRLYDRTQLAEEKSNDIRTWSLQKLNTVTRTLYLASLENAPILKTTSLAGMDAIITKGQNTRHLRPTVYDLLAHRALNYFMDGENDVTDASYKFILNDEKIFAPGKAFINYKFTTRDSSSLYYHAILLFQDILQWHINDISPAAFIDADLSRLAFVNDHGVFTNKTRLYEEALKHIEKSYPGNHLIAQAMFLRAQLYYSRGQEYNPLTSKANQFEIKKARNLLEEIARLFPGSEGAINSKNLLRQIDMPILNLETEKVNIPGQAFRTRVTYKNAEKIYLRLIKTDREEIKRFERIDYDRKWQQFLQLNPTRNWSQVLPNPQDYQEHTVEIKIDALPQGTYMILASLDANFSMANNIIARQICYVSNISYIINNKNELYVLHRDNGLPLKNAEVQIWQQSYNYNQRNYEEVKKDKFSTDQNGYVKLKTYKENNSQFIQVRHQGDELFTDDHYYNYSYNSYERPSHKKTFFFTDRSIYRPGQTIFFKGIVVSTDSASRKSSIVPGYKTTILLFDANFQKAGSMRVTSNEYGSYSGSFSLPDALLNGQFFIRDSVNQSIQYFSVEEYKRPKFSVEIKKPAGTYRVNDSIQVTGHAKAYAGNNIGGAKVSYRVVRKVRFPIWWGGGFYKIWPPYGRTPDMEISNGETITDANGEFLIRFKAIPDETIDAKSQPVFQYEVMADVTDINGETRSSTNNISVAYQALQLHIVLPDKLPADSLKNIVIRSTNLNDLFEKATVNFTIYKLVNPGRIFRSKYWQVPDQFVMSKSDYYAAFPHDAYADEDQPSNWPLGEKMIDVTDTTRTAGKWPAANLVLPSGWYKIILTTLDKYGIEVKAEKIIRLSDEKERSITEPVILLTSHNTAEPGQEISYSIATGFNKIWLIHTISRVDKSVQTSYASAANGELFRNRIAITENDRGGLVVSYAFIQHNRVYDGSDNIVVPWTNKELTISYESFRDKILPGSEEKWTIKITGERHEKVAAETLVSMYDASLDQFKKHSWLPLSSLWPGLPPSPVWTKPGFMAVASEQMNSKQQSHTDLPPKTYDELVNNGWNEGGYRVYFNRGDDLQVSAAPMQEQAVREVVVTKAVAGKASRSKTKGIETAADSIEIKEEQTAPAVNNGVQTRKDFKETAFFFPTLTTDANGSISFSFTIPEALTQWKLMTLAHTKELANGYSEKMVITQKPLMVQPNMPRFLREGDQVEVTAKIVNLSEKEVTGTAQLELFDAANNKAVDGWFKNVFPNQYFTVAPGQSMAVNFPIGIPVSFNSVLSYRIKAISKDGAFSDGEEAALVVLTNRVLVTETLPLNMRKSVSKNFRFEKLLSSGNSGSLTHHALTLEYSNNPAWYAVQALPYLMEYPYDCAEQHFNRYYANVLASFISNSTPGIKAIFEKWKTIDTAALISNLQKNQELKSALLLETPWVLAAQNESQQKKNIALLFDMVRLSRDMDRTLIKLREMQSGNGGFTWFRGGPDDRYITQYIISGIGHLRKLGALQAEDYAKLKPVVDKAMPYLDARLQEEYEYLLKGKIDLNKNNLSFTAIQYLYMHSFFPEYTVATRNRAAYKYYMDQSRKFWLSNTKYMQGMIALALHRTGDRATPAAIIKSLKENAIYKEEMGMYWKEFSTGGYYWHQAPVESQAMMIEAFSDIDKNLSVIDDMKTWLLKQKQTQQWHTTKATAEACYALLLNGNNWLTEEKTVSISLGNTVINSNQENGQAGTGYFKKKIAGDKVQQGMGNITVNVHSPAGQQVNNSSSWGAVYWQYFEELDKVSSAETPLKLVKQLFVEKHSDRGPVLKVLKDGDALRVGDKVKVRIELRVDRNMEYVHMKDLRAASMEPVNVISQYKYQGGLGYYESTKDASTSFFFGWLPRGTYIFEYPLFVTHTGNFSNGIATIQCMYAPEFSSHSNGIRINVEERK